MIGFIKSWCEGIIVAIILSIIIEMILPEGTNKKYVKVVIGIYIIFTILNPIIGKLNEKKDFTDIFNFTEVAATSTDENSIRKVYIDGIRKVLKEEIENQGFEVLDLEMSFDISYENIEKIILKIKEKDNTINIDYLKSIISDNYGISEEKILILDTNT